jgi:hypothetical protein
MSGGIMYKEHAGKINFGTYRLAAESGEPHKMLLPVVVKTNRFGGFNELYFDFENGHFFGKRISEFTAELKRGEVAIVPSQSNGSASETVLRIISNGKVSKESEEYIRAICQNYAERMNGVSSFSGFVLIQGERPEEEPETISTKTLDSLFSA